MIDTQAAVCSYCSRTGCNGVQFQRADPSYGWEVGYLKEYLDSEAAEAMHRLVLMMAKSLHHVGSAQLGLSQPRSNFLPSGCLVGLTPCQVASANSAKCSRVLV